MNDRKIVIKKRSGIKGDDGYKVFSVRIKNDTVRQLDDIAVRTNQYRNHLINVLLDFALANCVIEE